MRSPFYHRRNLRQGLIFPCLRKILFLCATLTTLFLLLLQARGQAVTPPPGNDHEALLGRADVAIARGLPHAVLSSLRTAWEETRQREDTLPQKILERLLGAEVLVGEAGAALAKLAAWPEERKTPEMLWWRAEALRQTGRWEEAAEAYAQAAEAYAQAAAAWDSGGREEARDRRAAALVGEARVRAFRGETQQALHALGEVSPASRLHGLATLEAADILLNQGRAKEAEELLSSLREVRPDIQPRQVVLLARARFEQANLAGALLALGTPRTAKATGSGPYAEEAAVMEARVLLALGNTGEAIRVLESYLRQAGGASPRTKAFALYNELLERSSAPSLSMLRLFVQDQNEPARASEAARYLALAEARAGRSGVARQILEDLPPSGDGVADELGTKLLLAQIELSAGQPAAIFSLLDSWPEDPHADFLRGQAYFQLREYAHAAQTFSRAAADPGLTLEASFNAAVSWMLGGFPAKAEEALTKLEGVDAGGKWRQEFRLVQALELARQGSPKTTEALRDLLPELGGRAAGPLAEWLLISNETENAQQILAEYPDAGDEESRAYLEIFLAGDRDEETRRETETRARDFLRRFPLSERSGSVRLKLAELRFQRGDFLGASEEFTAIAEEGTQPDLVQQAWFLAAQSAAAVMTDEALARAMVAYEEAASGGGELGQRARFEQGLLAAARGEYNDALVLLSKVGAEATDPELRAAALLEKGDVHFAMAANEPQHYRQAIAAWQSLAADAKVAAHWRRQALTKAGLAHEQLSENWPALELFYAVLMEETKGAPPDLWFERAGFEAGRLLEQRKSWREAIRVYEMIAAREGARAGEAQARANRLRLENFLWEE